MTQYDPNTLTGLLAEKASACPESPALEYRDSLMTFKELEERGRRVAGGLRAMGVQRSPTEIEAYIERHPQVVGVTTSKGPNVIAFVIPRAGVRLDEETFRAHCRDGMANYKVPLRFIAVDAFPVTVSANATKVQRKKMRDLAQQIVDGS